ncbi:NusG domain II-containing protein [Loigolactobacillus binensis]|uniref:NusG domain II-containing protein n=1 Tax=Loigolactobacillus binensis TaxID=2559922 RepID=A0ABW3EG29_9LACO|nr:NusG domain II-containing protein [Loigolactobacillus binensis]
MKMLKPLDIPIIILLIVLCFIPTGIFMWQQRSVNAASELYATIRVDRKVVKKVDLTANKKHYTFVLHPHRGQYNVIEVAGDQIRDKADNTPDQVAVHTSWISKLGQQSICLPHKLVIEIKSKDKQANSSTGTGMVQP